MKDSKKKLSLKKKTVFNLNDDEMKSTKGGQMSFTLTEFRCDGGGFTGGCSDGCDNNNSWFICPTDWNCTEQTCTNDCPVDIIG